MFSWNTFSLKAEVAKTFSLYSAFRDILKRVALERGEAVEVVAMLAGIWMRIDGSSRLKSF